MKSTQHMSHMSLPIALIALITLCCSGMARAQAQYPPLLVQRTQQTISNAQNATPERSKLPQADAQLQLELEKRTRQALEQEPMHRPVPDVQISKPKNGFDIEEVLRSAPKLGQAQSASAAQSNSEPSGPMVFISLAMPKNALVKLATDAKQVGGVLIMRGSVGGSLKQTVRALQDLSRQGVEIQIDPQAFQRYQVNVVPSFMVDLSSGSAGCEGTNACSQRSSLIEGDVSLAYALQHIHMNSPDGSLKRKVGTWIGLLGGQKEAGIGKFAP